MTARQIKKELDRQCVMFEEECKKGQVVATIKFETFAEQWFEEYAKLNLRSTTYERMKQLTARVYPAIGHLRIDKISPRQLQGFVNSLTKEGANEKTGKPLAPKTIRHNLSFISDVYSYAVKMGVVSDNPCAKVTIPKGEVKEKQIYSQEELELLLSRLTDEPTKYRAFFYLISYTGLRRSEMLGLEWKDVDFENNTIKVRRTSNYTAKKGIYTDTTKTKKSQRTQKYPQYVMDMLWELRKEQDEQCARMGNKWQDYDRLFIKWDGSPMNNNTPYFWFKKHRQGRARQSPTHLSLTKKKSRAAKKPNSLLKDHKFKIRTSAVTEIKDFEQQREPCCFAIKTKAKIRTKRNAPKRLC